MKKFISLFLVVIMVISCSINVFAAVKEPDDINVGGSGIGHKEEIISTRSNYGFVSWHPDFPEPLKRDFYYFSSQSITGSASLGATYGNVTVSFTIQGSGGSGSGIACDSSKWSRPAVYGDIYTQTYYTGMYNYNTNKWVSRTTATRYWVDNTEIIIRQSTVKSDLT